MRAKSARISRPTEDLATEDFYLENKFLISLFGNNYPGKFFVYFS